MKALIFVGVAAAALVSNAAMANADLAKAVTTTAAARTKMDDTIKAEVEKAAKA